ncbi:CRISPR-associated protein Cas1 [Candidatus Thiomargarita nelsonii]|uniref:CRISPR-associated endonuclease Cas1 n=1 Tax=Candidatus Thiomargarita nelsonii TaxID=1003181 RepID=A0A176S6T8_9GAMM|nr:CRISPR-associated protein Cas1 [Candidatus Thiomargarita nelsonii]
METLYLLAGTKMSRRDNTIRIAPKEGKARNFPVESLKNIIVAGVSQFNSELISFLGKQGVRLSFLDYYGNFSASVECAHPHASGSVHLAQAQNILDMKKRLALGKLIMGAGIQNIIGNLRYYVYRGKTGLKPAIEEIQKHRGNLMEAESVEQMMGCEGLSRQTYYAAWKLINPALTIKKRTRRPPTDRINSLISFCNALVYSACKNELSKTHLDLTLSFVHAPTQARASLSLDLAEIFKPVIADKIIFNMVNHKMFGESDFNETEGMCLLGESGRRKVVDAFREKMDREEIGDLRGYRALILRECFRIQAHVLGMETYVPYIHKV